MGKVLISFDDDLVRRIDDEARAQGLSRSAYLARLAQHELRRTASLTLRRRARALKALDDLADAAPAGESTTEIREAREQR